MPFTEFCCRNGGSNLNAGTRTGNSTEPGTAADFTYATGTWTSATNLFTAAAAIDGSIAVGDFVSIYDGSPALTGYVARIATVGSPANTNFTTSTTAFAGTKPGNIVGTATAKIGGAWKGPNAAENFPFNFVTNALTNSTPSYPRVNFKNDATYSITAAVSHSQTGPITWQGYTTAYADLGKATIDGGTSGASYKLLTLAAGNPYQMLVDLIFANNGATNAVDGVDMGGSQRNAAVRCVFHDVRGNGATGGVFQNCEAYLCNKSNTASNGGFGGTDALYCYSCISHDNSGSNSSGFYTQTAISVFVGCIADTNGSHGFDLNNINSVVIADCDAYNNGGSGIRKENGASAHLVIQNCNLIKNGAYGIDLSGVTTSNQGVVFNCGFGAGTQANTSGTVNGFSAVQQIGSVNYASNVTPWVDPANGDFRINLAAAINAGYGVYTQTQANYTGTIGYPDIGSAQHLESASGGGGHIIGG